MPATSGGSHSFSAFASMLTAAVISKFVWQHTPSFVEVSRRVGSVLVAATGVAFSPRFAGTLLIATALSFVWGVCYHVARH
ncbi:MULTISPECIES: hypothetical protein [Halorussus]|uniref:hypothetical protein n=1 Tax=Halorussus TaxID=1070314 RepID=UPI0013B4476E|nr:MULTISPECIES: hypothetical protein [Halorussus]NHN58610.1 hypothetical protein [Halorussus sp. JP-T4]